MSSWIKIKSFGGANTVTASAHEITADIKGFEYCYMVDCGLFQGSIAKKHPELNFNLRDEVKKIDAIFVTHAHIDHIGRIPAMYRWGYLGPVYATAPVCELAWPMLEDSAKIQVEEFIQNSEREFARSIRGESYKEVELLYDPEDAKGVMEQFRVVETEVEVEINDHLTVVFYNAGHGLGSASIKMIFNNGEETFTLLFSGDLGNENNPILRGVERPYITGVDAVFVETTYAGRFHASQTENWNEIRVNIAETILNGGRVILPAFAVGRTQEMLYILFKDMLENDDWVAKLFRETNIYVDSPLAIAATRVFKSFPDEFKPEVKAHMEQKGNGPFDFPNLQFVHEKEDSIELCSRDEACIILSAAGMCDAGRVIYHLRDNLENPDSAIVFTGFQAEGTLGRRLLDGEEIVNVAKKQCQVAAKFYEINTLSSHADQNGLIDWLNEIEPGYMLFLTHGEPETQSEFKKLLDQFGIFQSVECLELNAEYELSVNGFEKYVEEQEDQPKISKKEKKERDSLRKRDMQYILRLGDQIEDAQEEEGCTHMVSKIKREIKRLKFNSKKPFKLKPKKETRKR